MSRPPPSLLDELLGRCTFPPTGSSVACAFSGGPDSTALVALAVRHGLDVDRPPRRPPAAAPSRPTRPSRPPAIAAGSASVRAPHRRVDRGPNLEARARDARRDALPAGALTGHTADDQAETVLLRLLRGSGSDGLSAIEPGPAHPILALRRSETEAVCAELGIAPVRDASNASPAMWRNRIRHELLPLANDIAGRDVTPILARTADLLRDEAATARRAGGRARPDRRPRSPSPTHRRRSPVGRSGAGSPSTATRPTRPASSACWRVARGEAIACELSDGRRVERSRQRFRIVQRGPVASVPQCRSTATTYNRKPR